MYMVKEVSNSCFICVNMQTLLRCTFNIVEFVYLLKKGMVYPNFPKSGMIYTNNMSVCDGETILNTVSSHYGSCSFRRDDIDVDVTDGRLTYFFAINPESWRCNGLYYTGNGVTVCGNGEITGVHYKDNIFFVKNLVGIYSIYFDIFKRLNIDGWSWNDDGKAILGEKCLTQGEINVEVMSGTANEMRRKMVII